MAELEVAIERLERAVAQLENARRLDGRGSEDNNAQLTEIAARVDQALARIGRVLGEGR
jgi:hypothetical protein